MKIEEITYIDEQDIEEKNTTSNNFDNQPSNEIVSEFNRNDLSPFTIGSITISPACQDEVVIFEKKKVEVQNFFNRLWTIIKDFSVYQIDKFYGVIFPQLHKDSKKVEDFLVAINDHNTQIICSIDIINLLTSELNILIANFDNLKSRDAEMKKKHHIELFSKISFFKRRNLELLTKFRLLILSLEGMLEVKHKLIIKLCTKFDYRTVDEITLYTRTLKASKVVFDQVTTTLKTFDASLESIYIDLNYMSDLKSLFIELGAQLKILKHNYFDLSAILLTNIGNNINKIDEEKQSDMIGLISIEPDLIIFSSLKLSAYAKNIENSGKSFPDQSKFKSTGSDDDIKGFIDHNKNNKSWFSFRKNQ